ncbi:hypothetical protein OCF66_17030 [Bacillus toyonensis]|uniref:HNH endonuclease n=1 Tax=Bacillus toyonensis TaxID=155322 RepID=UPI0021D2D582|nr:hypothetical protein [Bacillus toyonensis]MCU5726669.1 hypothetical protein [Bacillus toyonensis]
MWKVEIRNIHKLYEFSDIFLNDVFIWATNNKGIALEEVESSISESRLLLFAKECSSLRKHMQKLAACSDIDNVYLMYLEYINHYELIIKGKFFSAIKITEETFKTVRNAFEYFYKEALDLKSFWTNYNLREYKSKNDFRRLVGEIRHRCPYCDINRISVADFSNTDHFLPISNYPFLGISWKNLVVSCIPCNTSIKNKSINLPILHPYIDRMQDELYFTFDIGNKAITINAKDNGFGTQAAENFDALFHLGENYSKLWDVVEREEKDIIREASRYLKKNRITDIKQGLQEINEILEERETNIYSQINIGECTKLKLDFYKYYREYNKYKLDKFLILEKYGADILDGQQVN